MKLSASTLSAETLSDLVEGRYRDPSSILGQKATPSGLLFRVWAPGAASVAVIHPETGRVLAKLECVHEAGVFEKVLRNRKRCVPYLLSVDDGPGSVDPYDNLMEISADAAYYFAEGRQVDAYHWLGAHACEVKGTRGVGFMLWAPNARAVSVMGDFNHWHGTQYPMTPHGDSGIWSLFLPQAKSGDCYKYRVHGADGVVREKADPFARQMERPSATGSVVVVEAPFEWTDQDWMARRGEIHTPASAISIYECHLGSWMRGDNNEYLSYDVLADRLIPYVQSLNFSHIQLMPVSEYPFDGSWGYQPVGLFAPTARFGCVAEFKRFVDRCHAAGLGVLLDWVPGHFPSDPHGLAQFDGTALFEHEDPRRGFHPDWNTYIYNYGRNEVRSFLLSNADFWLSECHIDGLRVDAVASMLYLDYSRKEGEWVPNMHGGRENLEAVSFLQTLNSLMYGRHPGIMMIAEESTAWPGVSHPVDSGGLGFGYKWNMGWMNDTLRYISKDPIHRSYHHDDMTFGMVYARDENFILSISHDECVHGKGSLLNKMPGDDWQKRANLRAYWGYMWAHPGKKLLFMGMEFGQYREWDHDHGLDWHLLDQAEHRALVTYLAELNRLYSRFPSLYQADQEAYGFQWLQSSNRDQSIYAWVRSSDAGKDVIAVFNATPTVHHGYRLGVPSLCDYEVILNSDETQFGGSGVDVTPSTEGVAWDDCAQSLVLTLPPLATIWLVPK